MNRTEWTLAYAALLSVMSVVTFAVYGWDKRQAKRQGWRVSERTLHTLELLGGWPGAWAAQRWLRHKSSKHSYRLAFWGIVLLHVVGVLAVMFFVG